MYIHTNVRQNPPSNGRENSDVIASQCTFRRWLKFLVSISAPHSVDRPLRAVVHACVRVLIKGRSPQETLVNPFLSYGRGFDTGLREPAWIAAIYSQWLEPPACARALENSRKRAKYKTRCAIRKHTCGSSFFFFFFFFVTPSRTSRVSRMYVWLILKV